jgi:hypothetical protein
MIDEAELRKVEGAVNTCCGDPKNIEIMTMGDKNGIFIRRCKVCGCNHYLVIADPGKYQRKLA